MQFTTFNLAWVHEQRSLKNKLSQNAIDCSKIRYVAGVDVAYTNKENQEYGCCSIVVIDYITLQIVEKVNHVGLVNVEYWPGFLSFRELPLILKATEKLKIQPDTFVFDGNGILHPEKMGIATHASFYLKRPCIGVAKTFFRCEANLTYIEPANDIGSSTNIINSNNEILGCALRTRQNCNPVFVSIGNYITLENAKTIVIHCVSKESRIPVPTRLADIETHKLRKEFLESIK